MDSVTISASTDQMALNRLSKAIANIEKQTGRSTYQSVMFATVKICDSGSHDSKPAKKLRPLIPDQRHSALTGGKSWVVEKLYQNKPAKRVRALGANDPVRKVPRVGTARNIWRIMKARAAATKSGTLVDFSKWHSLTVRTSPEVVASTIRNKLTYLEKAYPGQKLRIVAKGTIALERELDRQIDIAIARAI
jgi:hypothetical protein